MMRTTERAAESFADMSLMCGLCSAPSSVFILLGNRIELDEGKNSPGAHY